MEEFKPTPQMILERKKVIDDMVSDAGFGKDYWLDNEMPTYWDAEEMNPEEWDELMKHAEWMINRSRY